MKYIVRFPGNCSSEKGNPISGSTSWPSKPQNRFFFLFLLFSRITTFLLIPQLSFHITVLQTKPYLCHLQSEISAISPTRTDSTLLSCCCIARRMPQRKLAIAFFGSSRVSIAFDNRYFFSPFSQLHANT